VFPTSDIYGFRSYESDRVGALTFSAYGDLYIGVTLFGQFNGGGGYNVDPNAVGHIVPRSSTSSPPPRSRPMT
jgi:hypothetical protein